MFDRKITKSGENAMFFSCSGWAFEARKKPLLSFTVHCKKRLSVFTSPDGKSLTKLSQAGNNSIPGQPARESLVSDNPAGDGNITINFFYNVGLLSLTQE
jgi:hypothetical protein